MSATHSAPPFTSNMAPVLKRMHALGPVSPEQVRRVEALGQRQEVIPAKTVLQHENDAHVRARYLLSGWACRQRLLSDGRRQIFALLLPGDGVGLCLQRRPMVQATAVALTRVVAVEAGELMTTASLDACPECAAALDAAVRRDEAQLLDHLVRLGRQTAYERTAHLLLELHDRLATVELVRDGSFDLPLTQETLSDMLGLSVVHMNRTLQQLRREGLASLRHGRAHLHRPDLLATLADYRRGG